VVFIETTWNIRSLCRSLSLTTVARELSKYKVLVNIEEVRWEKGDTLREGNYTFSMEKETKTINWEQNFCTPQNRMSYIFFRGRRCNIIVLNRPATRKEKNFDSKDSFYEELQQVSGQFPKYRMKIWLEDFNAKLEREYIFRPTLGNDGLHQDVDDNGVGIVKFVTPKNFVVKCTMFPHRNIHKHNRTSRDRQTHDQIVHILMDRRWHSTLLDVRSS
jgi:hypothetical protein